MWEPACRSTYRYWLKSLRIAAIAASLIWGGAGKSGNPVAHTEHTSSTYFLYTMSDPHSTQITKEFHISVVEFRIWRCFHRCIFGLQSIKPLRLWIAICTSMLITIQTYFCNLKTPKIDKYRTLLRWLQTKEFRNESKGKSGRAN